MKQTIKPEELPEGLVEKIREVRLKYFTQSNEYLEDIGDFYRFNNVKYNQGLYTVDWTKELLNNGDYKSSKKWIPCAKEHGVEIPSLPLYHASINHIYGLKDKITDKELLKKVVKNFKRDLNSGYLSAMTSTSLKSSTNGDCTITHDIGQKDERTYNEKYVVEPAYINEKCEYPQFIKDLFETDTLEGFEESYLYVQGNYDRPFLWSRLPKKDDLCGYHSAIVIGWTSGMYGPKLTIDTVSRSCIFSRGVITKRIN